MDNPIDELWRRLDCIRREAKARIGPKYFFPPEEIKTLLTHAEICRCLSLLPELQSNPLDVHRFASIIQTTAVLVFAILLYDGNHSHILRFLTRQDTNTRLHYTEEALHYLDPRVRRQFLARQWEFIPVHFSRHDPVHRKLSCHAVLPILSETEAGRGGFGTVWKIELNPSCQSLVPMMVEQDKELAPSPKPVVLARKELEEGDGETERRVLYLLQTLKHPNIVEYLGSYR
jgi:hypothetical protein